MDNLIFEIRQADDPTRASAGRLVGTLLRYEEVARDRAEVFVRGALSWDKEAGVLINVMHERTAPLLRAFPYLDGDSVKIDAPVPPTGCRQGRCHEHPEGVYSGLSLEFKSLAEGRRGPLREIRKAHIHAGALVDTAAYGGSTVEVRAKGSDVQRRIARLWL